MALDEPNSKDEVFTIGGHTFVAEAEFIKQAAPVKIDFTSMGFKIDSSMDFGGSGCGSCSGSCSTGH